MSVDGQIPKMSARTRSVEPVEISRIFNSTNPDSPVKPSPAEHIGSPTTPPSKNGSSQSPKAAVSPAFKRLSATATNRAKSTSFSFPVMPTQFTNPYQPSEAPKESNVQPMKTENATAPEPNILQALAAQERHVLEIKEQLHAAEEELKRLKRQWATQESSKKRNDVRRVHHMRPMSISIAKTAGGADDLDGSSTWLYEEMERRKSLLKNAKTSRRRVFPGSRHTRTLSLLSPEKMNGLPPPPDDPQTAKPNPNPVRLSRLSTSPELPTLEDEDPTGADSHSDRQPPTPQREAFVRSSKQMATDLKEGLWTFFEDLRQAAVGEEARKSTPEPGTSPPKPIKARNTRRPKALENGQSVDLGGSFWRNSGMESDEIQTIIPERSLRKIIKPPKLSTAIPKPKTRTMIDGNNEVWDTWSSPISQKDNSAVPTSKASSRSNSHSETTGVSHVSVSRTMNNNPKSPSKIPLAIPPATPSASMEPPPSANRLSRIPRLSLADQRALSYSITSSNNDVDKRRESMQWASTNHLDNVSPIAHNRRATHYFSNDWDKSVTSEEMPAEEMF